MTFRTAPAALPPALRSAALATALLLALPVATAADPAAPKPAAKPASAPASARATEPDPDRRVIEDDNVRIEETRRRGELQSVTVQSKVAGVRPYQIVVPRGGRDPSQDKSAAGQRVWSVLNF